jgi:hypothetical protein
MSVEFISAKISSFERMSGGQAVLDGGIEVEIDQRASPVFSPGFATKAAKGSMLPVRRSGQLRMNG